MGLDIEVYPLQKVKKSKKWTSEEIEEKYPDLSVCTFHPGDLDNIPGADRYLFDIDQQVINYKKLVENTSTPEHPRKWEDGWRWAGEGTSPWKEIPDLPKAPWYMHFVLSEEDKKDENGCRIDIDDVWIPMTKEVIEKAKDRADYKAILHGSEKGYQRKGMKSEFYDFISKRGCSWVFTLEELLKIKEMAENPEEFQANILDNFEDGKDVVWFWY